MTPVNALRWLAVVPAALAGWYLALASGILLHSLATSLCPDALLVSGMCTAGWFEWLEQGIFAFTAALAAFLVVWLAVLCCPSTGPGTKARVAAIAFALGALVAIVFAAKLHIWLAPLAALISGLVTLRWLRGRHCEHQQRN